MNDETEATMAKEKGKQPRKRRGDARVCARVYAFEGEREKERERNEKMRRIYF